jgi:predicted nucleic acid-binding protein
MTFADIPSNATVFVDANTFVYHFTLDPVLAAPCTQFLDRIARQEIRGMTAADVLNDVAHRVMVLEASVVLGWTGTGISKRLRKQPGEIKKLTRFRQAVHEVLGFGIHVIPITSSLVGTATAISQQRGLLSGDALIVAVMQQHGITHLASLDSDFDHVPGISRYAPI